MIFQRFFAPRPQVAAGRALFVSASDKARDPAFYAEDGAPDTPEGRFELYALHVVLLLRRLRGEDAVIAETRQALFDAFVRNLDDGLREMGVGDLSVGKKMRKLGAAVYGRLKSYNAALEGDAEEDLPALIRRTVLARKDGFAAAEGGAERFAAYVRAADAGLASESLQALLKGDARWPSFPA